VGDIPIEVSNELDVGVVGGCESLATTSASPSAKCGCGYRLLASKALLGVLLVVAGLPVGPGPITSTCGLLGYLGIIGPHDVQAYGGRQEGHKPLPRLRFWTASNSVDN